MTKKIVSSLALASMITGCSIPSTLSMPRMPHITKEKPTITYEKPTPQKQEAFNKAMSQVALSTKEDPRYKKLALDTPEKKTWFKNLMYRLWDRQITREQFVHEGLQKYPDRAYEFNYIANGFQKYS